MMVKYFYFGNWVVCETFQGQIGVASKVDVDEDMNMHTKVKQLGANIM
jgi:hypothetical protein